MPGMVYIFLTSERPVSHEEIDDLCIKYFDEHQKIALPKQALQVDLRPAFSVPLEEITGAQFLSVPIE